MSSSSKVAILQTVRRTLARVDAAVAAELLDLGSADRDCGFSAEPAVRAALDSALELSEASVFASEQFGLDSLDDAALIAWSKSARDENVVGVQIGRAHV